MKKENVITAINLLSLLCLLAMLASAMIAFGAGISGDMALASGFGTVLLSVGNFFFFLRLFAIFIERLE